MQCLAVALLLIVMSVTLDTAALAFAGVQALVLPLGLGRSVEINVAYRVWPDGSDNPTPGIVARDLRVRAGYDDGNGTYTLLGDTTVPIWPWW